MDRRLLLNKIDRYYWLIFASLVFLGILGGYVAYTTYTTTETVTSERVVSKATTLSEFNHGATVQRGTVVFSEGVELENRKLYFTNLSPLLNGTYLVRHGGEDPEPAQARIELRLVLRSVGDGGTVYWKESEPLTSANRSELSPGNTLTAPFSVNITRSLNRVASIRENLSASPGSSEILVKANSVVEGEVGGERFVDTRSESLSISAGRGTYSVSSDTEGRKVHESRRTFVEEKGPSSTNLYGGSFVFVASILAFISLERKREQGLFDVPEEELNEAIFEMEKERFDEWISQGSVEEDEERQEVRLSSLTDLVDTAIDSNRRVIETQEDSKYVVLTGEFEYVFDRREQEDDRQKSNESDAQGKRSHGDN